MIKPFDNIHATVIIDIAYAFPLRRFLRCSRLTWKCHALIRADRYLAKNDKVKP